MRSRKKRLPICTLPMMGGKMYLISSPPLIAAAMRNRDLSLAPYAVKFSGNLFGIPQEYLDRWSRPGWFDGLVHVVHNSLAGDNLRETNVACYRELAAILNQYEGGRTIELPNARDWLAEVVTRAFTRALFGEKNPVKVEDFGALWYVIFQERWSRNCHCGS